MKKYLPLAYAPILLASIAACGGGKIESLTDAAALAEKTLRTGEHAETHELVSVSRRPSAEPGESESYIARLNPRPGNESAALAIHINPDGTTHVEPYRGRGDAVARRRIVRAPQEPAAEEQPTPAAEQPETP